MSASTPRDVSTRTVVGLLLVIAAIDVVTARVTPPSVDPVFRFAVVVGLAWWARSIVQLSWAELGLAREKLGSGLRWGLLAMLAVAAVIVVMVAIPATRSYFEDADVRADSTLAHVMEPLVAIPLATVVFEELIFRGVLLGVLLRFTTRVRAVIGASLAFGLWHIPPALSDASGHSVLEVIGIVAGTIAFTTIAGALFCWLRLRSGSLLAPVLGHIASNSFAYVGALVALND